MGTQYDDKRYLRSGRLGDAFNRLVGRLTGLGVSVAGSRLLTVKGRKSGEPRSVPVNVLTHEGERYLVAPRGHTQWVRNVRAAGEAELRVGKRVETIRPVELADADKPPVIRAYLKKWAWEVGAFFGDINAETPEAELLRVAPGFPVFRIP
ncbi:nitroreductase family deazaflavin-dependent oxidoreductase [Prauserella cavernicola]|uniref:Nitroreductase family deazaflavin-dependent oxidoreductase n=1 Tax=Prauserella cavernicola TaxID=2800127 RepID=A0A934QRK5_9PSEU|nr:nitroreductase family deazaflavin-dependent oxidoreductase [Prauserella cavernicola]MBK1784967.1 nitroreductase family deazaflavin-dependent oxidoreductase [Prauserella cavernicola]